MANKKDILFIGLHRPKRSPSQRYRIEQFLPYLESHGVKYDYEFLLTEKMDKSFYAPGHYFSKAMIVVKSVLKLSYITFFKSRNYKVVFVQREAFMMGTAFFEKQMAKHARLIFDFDDSIWMPNVSKANAKLAFLKNAKKTADIIQAADLNIVGNAYLADYAAKFSKSVSIIPTCVDTDEYLRKSSYEFKSSSKICIGWSGSQTTIEHFRLIEPILEKIKDKYQDRVYFKVVGDPSYLNNSLSIKGVKWTKETELAELEEMDIGIMPLPKDEWSKGKCGLKALVYMSMEIPAVAENHGVNSEIIANEVNGLLCSNEEEWINQLSLLIEDKSLRISLGKAGRQSVINKYSIIANQDKFLNLIRDEK